MSGVSEMGSDPNCCGVRRVRNGVGPQLLCLALAACDGGAPKVVPGERIGDVSLGMSWGSVRAQLGDPPNAPNVLGGLVHASWSNGYEVLLASPEPVSDDAVVIGVATKNDGTFGTPDESYAGADFYASGMGIENGRVAVFAARGARRTEITTVTPPSNMRVIDMHLHPGDYETMADSGKAFITGNLPRFLRIFAPELLDTISDPWAPYIGIADQTTRAGVGHAVLFAVYAPQSIGVFSNDALIEILDDARNITNDGRPWAWGMASLDLGEWSEDIAPARLAALRADLTNPKIIGIKLAFAHQDVALDDATTRGIYAIAQEARVPILHHTGFSPFPGTKSDPRYYDPQYLEALLEAYPDVQVVLSHVGQGDARAVEHALELAERQENVWLELSALGRPLLVDQTGAQIMTAEPQYPAVLAAIRERGLIERTLFASDGPQYPGAIAAYLGRLVEGMRAASYSDAEIDGVLAGHFEKLYTRTKQLSSGRAAASDR